MKFSIDTNILVYACLNDAGWKHDRAVNLLEEAAEAECILTVQELGEFYHVATRKYRQTPKTARRYVTDWSNIFGLTAAKPDDLEQALDTLRKHSLSFWDALLWATARSAGCQALLSEDLQDGRVLGGVTILNPFAQANAERIAGLMRG